MPFFSHQAAQQEQEEQEEQEQEKSPLDRTAALLATDLTHAFLKVRKPMDALELYHKEIVLEESEDKDSFQMKCLIIFYSSG